MNAVVSLRHKTSHVAVADGGALTDAALPPQSEEVLRTMKKCTSVVLCYPPDGGYRTSVSLKTGAGAMISAQELVALRERRDILGRHLAPAGRADLLARILALLSHYRSDAHAPQVEQIIASDWAEDLGQYPLWAINAAARTWRREQKFKPQIAEMRTLCERITRDALDEIATIERLIGLCEQELSSPGSP